MKLAIRQFIILFFSGLILWLFALQIERHSIRTPIVADYVKDLEKTLHKSETEINATKAIILDGRNYFLLNSNNHPVDMPLTETFSSRSAEQFTDEELRELILDPPSQDLL